MSDLSCMFILLAFGLIALSLQEVDWTKRNK